MSKDKGSQPDRQESETAADAAGQEDPMTSFDPDAEDTAGGPPAERSAPGNGSASAAGTSEPPEPPSQGEAPSGEPAAEGDTAGPGTAEPAEAAEGGAPPAAEEAAAETGPSELEQARAENADLHDRYLRLQAEFENYKKRIAKEHADSLRYALTPLVTEVAAVLDNLERALEHARKEQGEAVAALVEGIEMVLKHLYETLNRFGVTRIEAVGKPFDPSQHEAIQVVETEDAPDNQVLEEYQAGYLLHDRVIRPARVSVSKRVSDAS